MFKKSWLKACALFAVLFVGAAQLPALAAPYQELNAEDVAMQGKYVDSMSRGIAKFYEIRHGKPVAPGQLAEIRRILAETFPKIIAVVKRSEYYEEYKAHMFDTEIDRMNEDILSAPNAAEIQKRSQVQVEYIAKKYPRLTQWMNSNQELRNIAMGMFERVRNVLK